MEAILYRQYYVDTPFSVGKTVVASNSGFNFFEISLGDYKLPVTWLTFKTIYK